MPKAATLPVALLGVALVAMADYVTGSELRIFPLYFVPITVAASRSNQRASFGVAVLSALAWLLSNHFAAKTPPNPIIELWNFFVQGVAFVLVGYLLSRLNGSLQRERALSRTDALTGLQNPRAFYEQAQRSLSACRRHGRPIAIAYIDVDDFKRVNDSLGHQGGDAVLRQVAQTLASATRGDDLAARMGGDEFAALLPETGYEGAKAFLERVRNTLERNLAQGPLTVTLSIGAIVFLNAPASIDQLVGQADKLMYAAKAAGKNRFHVEMVSDN